MPPHPSVRAVTCPHCGAKLAWTGTPTIVECRYCQTHVSVATGSRTMLPHDAVSLLVQGAMARGAAAPSTRKASHTMWIILGVGTLVGGGIAGSALLGGGSHSSRSAGSSARAVSMAQASKVMLDVTLARMVAEQHARQAGSVAELAIADGPFATIQFQWPHDENHVGTIAAYGRPGLDIAPILERLRGELGRRFDTTSDEGKATYQTTGLWMTVTRNGEGAAQFAISGDARDPRWREKTVAMWGVLLRAGFETGAPLDAATKRELLGTGDPLGALADLPLDTKLEGMEAAVKKIAPSAVVNGDNVDVALDHPLFSSVNLRWRNEEGGAWGFVVLYRGKAAPSHLDRIPACVTPLLGTPKKVVTDAARKQYFFQFPARHGHPWVDVNADTTMFYPHNVFGEKPTEAGTRALIAALAACT